MQGTPPPTSGYESVPAGSTPPPPGATMQPPYGFPHEEAYISLVRQRASRLPLTLATVAVLLAGVALVVSIVREPGLESLKLPSDADQMRQPAGVFDQQLFVDDEDKTLCIAIAPLMKEASERNKAFGPLAPGSPEQAAAIPGYRAFVRDWAPRMQSLLNQHSDPPRFLTRTLQAYIDDNLLYVELVQPNFVDAFDHAAWVQGAVDYGGPLSTCSKLGVDW